MGFCFLNLVICFIFEKFIVSCLIKVWSKHVFKKNQNTLKRIDFEATLNLINDVKNYVRENKKKKNLLIKA